MNTFIVRLVNFILFFLATCYPLTSYALTSSELDQKIQQVTNHYLQQHGVKHGFTAVEISVLLPDETKPRNYVAGTISKQSHKLATTDMFVQYGSNTKMFTASLIIKLINKKIINYDTILAAIFPEKFTDQNTHSWLQAWKSITIKQLLDMTSGIPDIFRTQGIWIKINPYEQYSLNELINLVAHYQQITECRAK